MGSERGWALVSVLWAVTMLMLMAAATQQLAVISHRNEHQAWEREVAEAVLEGGVVEAVAGMAAPTISERWRVDGASYNITIGGFAVRITVQSEAGRYDLNVADASVLIDLLRSAGLDADRADALAGSILDWRSPRPFHALNGATDDDYITAGLPYKPRHAAFQSVDELQLVLGMTPSLFKRVRPALTVYTKRATIDPAVAPEEALMTLYRGDRNRVDELLRLRENQSTVESAGEAIGIIPAGLSLAGATFTIVTHTEISHRIYRRSIVVPLTGAQPRPFVTLARSS